MFMSAAIPTPIHQPIWVYTRPNNHNPQIAAHKFDSLAIFKGTGSIGKHIVQELVDQGFQVSILSRNSKHDSVPKGVTLKTVDYDDLESLKSALTGQDAVVSTIATAAVGAQQQKLADAAFAVGVKRFVPSEFGINTRKLQGLKIGQIVAGKTKLVDDLQQKAEQNSRFSWTGLSNGLFFDLVRTCLAELHMLHVLSRFRPRP